MFRVFPPNGSRVPAAIRAGLVVLAILALPGCGSTPSAYIHPNFDFRFVQRVAVLPYQNLTADRIAGERLQSIFLIELLDEEVLEVVDPRETVEAMMSLGLNPGTALNPEQAVQLGKRLEVDALFFGVVEEYGYSRGDRSRGPEITAVFGMTETQTGTEIWRTQAHETGSSIWKKLFGGGSDDIYTVSRDVVRRALDTLL
jgi:hypothetical protein